MSVLKHTNSCLDCRRNNYAVWKLNTDTDTDTDTIFLFFFCLYNINIPFLLRLCVLSSLFFYSQFQCWKSNFFFVIFCFVLFARNKRLEFWILLLNIAWIWYVNVCMKWWVPYLLLFFFLIYLSLSFTRIGITWL